MLGGVIKVCVWVTDAVASIAIECQMTSVSLETQLHRLYNKNTLFHSIPLHWKGLGGHADLILIRHGLSKQHDYLAQ